MNKIHRLTILLSLGILIPVPVLAETLFAITVSANDETSLVSFDSATPGTFISGPTRVTGLAAGEGLIAIDFRPATKQLYGFATSTFLRFRLYTINTATGAATPVGLGFNAPNRIAIPGFDFNPVADRIRVINEDGQNFRVNPDSGDVVDGNTSLPGTQGDTRLAFASGDVNFGEIPRAGGAAYTNNVAGAASTTLYAIEASNNILVTQGGLGGSPSPNGGQLFTVGSGLTSVQTPLVGFDISRSGAAFLSATTAATGSSGAGVFTGSTFYTVDLGTGVASSINAIGTTSNIGILDIAVAPPSVQFSAARYNVNENAGTATITVTRTNGSSGAITVNYTTADGSAVATSDYTPSSGVISFADGDTNPKTFTVSVTDDTASENSETLNLILRSPTGDVALGAQATASLVIADNDRSTGGGGGGCTINPRTAFDPLLPVMLLLALAYLLRRRLGGKS